MYSKQKLDAIYELRRAVAEKTLCELAVDRDPSAANRDALLRAMLRVEDLTQTVIELCHSCDRPTTGDVPYTAEPTSRWDQKRPRPSTGT
jgi:hypothetical protein